MKKLKLLSLILSLLVLTIGPSSAAKTCSNENVTEIESRVSSCYERCTEVCSAGSSSSSSFSNSFNGGAPGMTEDSSGMTNSNTESNECVMCRADCAWLERSMRADCMGVDFDETPPSLEDPPEEDEGGDEGGEEGGENVPENPDEEDEEEEQSFKVYPANKYDKKYKNFRRLRIK